MISVTDNHEQNVVGMLRKLNRITNGQAAIIIAFVGLAVYGIGLNNPFQGDDFTQLINSLPVHSITRIKLFFEGSTFYIGKGYVPLWGVYYKPLMLVVYSLLYMLFGPHQFYYHAVQLALCIGNTLLVYLFFRFSFKPLLALPLALIFLVHPIDSQVVYAIPSMQDALFFFFGMLGLYLLIAYRSSGKIVLLAAVCMFLSLLSKETGILFVLMALVYLYLFDERRRFYSFSGISIVPVVLWLVLKVNAVGLGRNPNAGPIDKASFVGRLLNMPSVIEFYILKFLFPWRLASNYLWAHTTFSLRYVLVPLIVDLIALAGLVYVGLLVRKKASKAQFYTYIFFFVWFWVGVGIHSQLLALDSTATEPWFYFPMVGILGMLGVTVGSVVHLSARTVATAGFLLVIVFGARSALRGLDWRSWQTLAARDVVASKEDYEAYTNLSDYAIQQNNYQLAAFDARKAIAMYPTANDYNNLAVSMAHLGKYSQAVAAYDHAAQYGSREQIEDTLALLTTVNGFSPTVNHVFLLHQLSTYPNDHILWIYLALLDERYYTNAAARYDIQQAERYGPVPSFISNGITQAKPFRVTVAGLNRVVQI